MFADKKRILEGSQLDFLVYSYLYYIEDKTLISDNLYDNMCKWLLNHMKTMDKDIVEESKYYDLCKELDESCSGFYLKEKDYPEYVKMISYKIERQKEEKREIPLEKIKREWEEKNDMFDVLDKEPIIMYTDGSSSNNKTRCAGYGTVYKYKDHYREIYGGFEPDTTNQYSELYSVIAGLEKIKTTDIPIHVHSDSAYVIRCMNENWIENKWMMNGWVNSKNEPVSNKELWERLYKLVKNQTYIKWVKVKGHQGIILNERADDLSVLGRHEVEVKLGLRNEATGKDCMCKQCKSAREEFDECNY